MKLIGAAVRFAVHVILAVVYLVIVLALPSCLWLLFHAQTVAGWAVAVVGVLLFLLPLLLWLRRFPLRYPRFWQRTCWGMEGLLVVATAFLLYQAPDGCSSRESPIQHHFTRPGKFPVYSIANVVPEIEQINLGFFVIPFLDPIFSFRQAGRVRPFTMRLYREMERDPDFHRLGSVLGWAYSDMFGGPFDVGHYYLYVPRKASVGPRPVLVFLHGSLGNFKPYTWVWSRLAEERGMIVVSPSFGFGNWEQPGGAEAVLRTLDAVRREMPVDEKRIYLAGLSNGGLGVCRLAVEAPDIFRGLIFLSPVIIPDLVRSDTFQQRWRKRPVLVIAGEQDERIPLDFVLGQASAMESEGVQVTRRTFPGEDHFLFFSQPDPILKTVSDWMSRAEQK
jgi:pimeloyl-ACP methyl ester carboxylesterase